MHRLRVLRAGVRALETEVVIPMTDLRGAAGTHDVDLRGEAVVRAQPRGGDKGEKKVVMS